MRYRKLGKWGLQVSEIGVGCLEYGDKVPEAEAVRVVHAALDAGVTLFDTAGYSGGRSEEILGKALKGRRHQAVIATKVAPPRGPASDGKGFSRSYIMQCLEVSLRRLSADYIDLYQVHYPDPQTPMEETLSVFQDLIRAGKVRYAGSSNFPAWYLCNAQWLARSQGRPAFASTQVRYNLITRDVEQELLPLCRQEGIGVLVYNPLAGSFLAGIYRQDEEPAPTTRFGWRSDLVDLRPFYMKRYWWKENFEALEALRRLWKDSGKSLAQHALAWVLANPLVSSALVGPSSVRQLEEDLGAEETALSPQELQVCDEIWARLSPRMPYYQLF